MRIYILFLLVLTIGSSCDKNKQATVGQTSITKWPDDKKSAISITYDDGTINQFTVARPIMNKLDIPGTFYIITGKVKGSGKGKFIGRDKNKIIKETETSSTNEENFFERASLIAFTGDKDAVEYHSRAGSLFESGKIDEAYTLIDEAYQKLRNKKLNTIDDIIYHDNRVDTTTWEDYKAYAEEGHEIASHTVTHPRLAVLDETNMLYELEQSKADIANFLGEEYAFSAECPYGTENERVMEYAHKIYPALRNRMPAAYLKELNRSNKTQPGESDKEYVQWQRGPLQNINMDQMKSWVDTCLAHDNIWLVLVFHGIDGIGWEPRTGAELEEYFSYMKEKEPDLWIATFADVSKYLRQRKAATMENKLVNNTIQINLSSTLDPEVYNIPLSLKTYVPSDWLNVKLNNSRELEVQSDAKGSYVVYSISANEKAINLTSGS